jgi:NADPH:quinone reductase-like Zn-dependent oxidoreductase
MQGVFELAAKGYLKPVIGHVYDHQELAQAHSDLENRNSVGKLVVCWET